MGSTHNPAAAPDLVIRNAYIVTMDADRTIWPRGALAVQDGEILAVGDEAEISRRFEAAETTIDARGHMVLPGLIDAHCHVALGAMQALTGDSPATAAAWPAVANNGPFARGGDIPSIAQRSASLSAFSPEISYWAARATAIELLRAGVTTVVDGGAPDALAAADGLTDAGLRAGIGFPMSDVVAGPGDEPLQRVQDADALLSAAEEHIATIRNRHDLLTPWLILTMGVACSDELCEGTRVLAAKHGVRYSSHLATLENEEAYSRRLWGNAPVERFEALGLLGPAFLGIHMGWVREADIPRLVRSGASVAHCPQASARLAHGIYANGMIPKMLEAGVTVGLGTDTPDMGSMLQMLVLASSLGKEFSKDMRVMDAPQVLEMVTRGSARCAGLQDVAGTLEAGRRADLLIVNTDGIHYHPDRNPGRVFVEVARSRDVHTVIVDGRILLRDGELLLDDEAKVRDEYYAALQREHQRAN